MKNIQLKQLIKENINQLKESVSREYDNSFFDMAKSEFKNKKISGWSFEIDPHSGTFMWNKNRTTVLATPFWELEAKIPVDVISDTGSGDPEHYGEFDFKPSGDVKKDIQRYESFMKKLFSKIK